MEATAAVSSNNQDQAQAPVASPFKTRVRTWLHRHRTDLELAAGSDPNVDPLRRERARELLREETRRKMADQLERALLEADSAPRPRTSRAPLARRAIHSSRSDLETIVERLRAPIAVAPQGVAEASLLLSQGTGPLYGSPDRSEEDLRRASGDAVHALDHGPRLAG